MVGNKVKAMAASLMLAGTLSMPTIASAEHRHSNHCRHRAGYVVNDGYARGYNSGYGRGYGRGYERGYGRGYRRGYDRPVVYREYRPARRAYYERAPHRRSRGRSALVIAGSAATGAGIGGAVRGGKGALIGAAIGGGAASIYEGARRRR